MPLTQTLLKNAAIADAALPTNPWTPDKNPAIIPGNKSMESAKIIGITPAGFTFNGK